MLDWNALVDEYGPMVVRISWRILGHAADVEDNVQEVFLEAFCLQKRKQVRRWGGPVAPIGDRGRAGQAAASPA